MRSSFLDELVKLSMAYGADVSNYALRKRFTALHRYLRNHGAALNQLNPDIKRIAIPKTKLTENHLGRLGFKSVMLAIPETGQEKIRNYRHPVTNHHLHDHGENWVMHEDSHPSSTMLSERYSMREKGEDFIDAIIRKKGKKREALRIPDSKLDASIEGAKHLITEGGPGLYGYIKNQIVGGRPMSERVLESTGRARSLIRRMRNFKVPDPVTPPIDSSAAPEAPPVAPVEVPAPKL